MLKEVGIDAPHIDLSRSRIRKQSPRQVSTYPTSAGEASPSLPSHLHTSPPLATAYPAPAGKAGSHLPTR